MINLLLQVTWLQYLHRRPGWPNVAQVPLCRAPEIFISLCAIGLKLGMDHGFSVITNDTKFRISTTHTAIVTFDCIFDAEFVVQI